MSLKNWLANGWLVAHETSAEEIGDLLALVERDLADAAVEHVSPDWRSSIAYNAILQLATLALAAEGYRAERQRAHERAVLSLRHTIRAEPDLVDTIDGIRRKRNLTSYERSGVVSEREAREVIGIANDLQVRVLAWLRRNHPDLVSAG